MPRKTTKKTTKKKVTHKSLDEIKLRDILNSVYMAGLKKNKAKLIRAPFQLSVDQAIDEIKKLW